MHYANLVLTEFVYSDVQTITSARKLVINWGKEGTAV